MKVAFSGSRWFSDYTAFCAIVAAAKAKHQFLITVVLHGDYLGADALAKRFGRHNRLAVVPFRPKVEIYGSPAAYHIRNKEMIREAEALIAMPSSLRSQGTWNTVKLAEQKGIPVFVQVVDARPGAPRRRARADG